MHEFEINRIIKQSTQGELTGFSDLYKSYARMIRSVLYKFCQPEEIDDLVQDAFIKIWNGLPRFKQNCKLKTWVYRVTYNLALDHVRKKKLKIADIDLQRISAGSEENEFMKKDLVQKSLTTLTEEHRAVLVLHSMEGLSVDEVADVLEIPSGTVKSRLHHARSKMHDALTASGVKL
ncbi:MAG: sigma-70 family RNA polymerase sigma factor [bacterium]|nr:sigma-70 family RNA polymerase sigma factor [bacterium]MBU1918333.1 sigma-70 family RNA polymerase sigma factor [bacterium]